MGGPDRSAVIQFPDHAAVRIVCLLVLSVNENGGISDNGIPTLQAK